MEGEGNRREQKGTEYKKQVQREADKERVKKEMREERKQKQNDRVKIKNSWRTPVRREVLTGWRAD